VEGGQRQHSNRTEVAEAVMSELSTVYQHPLTTGEPNAQLQLLHVRLCLHLACWLQPQPRQSSNLFTHFVGTTSCNMFARTTTLTGRTLNCAAPSQLLLSFRQGRGGERRGRCGGGRDGAAAVRGGGLAEDRPAVWAPNDSH